MSASLSQSLSFVVPVADRDDPEPVRSSLAQASADLARGEIREALRHLRRAAEGADEAGSELRAVALARAAADLANEAGASMTPPPAGVASAPPNATSSNAPLSIVRGTSDAALKQLLDSGRAVRVVVKRSARDEALYVVRRADGPPSALGTREAVIVLLEPDDGFFGPEKPHG